MAASMCKHLTRVKFNIFYSTNRRFCLTSAALLKMSTATVRIYIGEPHLNISFHYGNQVIPARQFNFRRLANESIKDSFNRIAANIGKCYDKKKKKLKRKLNSDSDSVNLDLPLVSMTRNGTVLPEDTLNCDAWNESTVLNIGEVNFKISVNPPTIQSIKLPSNIMSGFPVHPYVELDFANFQDCKFVWYKSEMNIADRYKTQQKLPPTSEMKWLPLTTEPIYYSNNTDIGHMLRVVCIPISGDREGKTDEAISEDTVGAGPGSCPYHARHEFTKEKTSPNNFRVVTYNILADCYADTDYSHEHLFSHCPDYALAWSYRKQLILDELVGYNADIICLQEVDKKLFMNDLKLFLECLKFKGTFDTKGDMNEGLACFYSTSKFRKLSSTTFNLGTEAKTNEIFSNLVEKVSVNEQLAERFFNRSTILQITELEMLNDSTKKLLVCNSHFYFHPDADHIRLLQASVCIQFIEQMLKLKKAENPDGRYSMIFCGDFNSCPEFGVYQLMTTKSVPKDSADWNSCPGEEVKDLNVSHNLNIQSACGCPEYTNYTPLFQGCLDYIFYDTDNLESKNQVPLPSHEQVVLMAPGIPNATFPSDHLSLISDFCWKDG